MEVAAGVDTSRQIRSSNSTLMDHVFQRHA